MNLYVSLGIDGRGDQLDAILFGDIQDGGALQSRGDRFDAGDGADFFGKVGGDRLTDGGDDFQRRATGERLEDFVERRLGRAGGEGDRDDGGDADGDAGHREEGAARVLAGFAEA